ncbi:hypothetical protein [Amycolatopsis sp. NPDC098790]|uniref:methylation-associated defense system restriction endonuclease subunit S MAD5 n=1 Tax=Amycolatopsis sp. NPDC098790 TaxID=3363939 RepID=UPI00380A4C9D
MKLAALDDPVHASWLTDQGCRLDSGPYVSEAYAARMHLRRVPHTEPLGEVAERIFQPGRFRREWTTAPECGVPFLGSADIFEADLSNSAMITENAFRGNRRLALEPGWTLVTRSGMTAGRVTYARLGMRGYACSEDVLRIVPDLARVPSGYLYTFLASRYGIPIIKGGIYGTSVRHIEAEHVANLPVPRFEGSVEQDIDDLIANAMTLRQRYEDGVSAATDDLFRSAGIPELLDLHWHEQGRDLGFSIPSPTATSLRAINFAPRVQRIVSKLSTVPHRRLADICKGGSLTSGARFKRINSDPGHGARLIGQRQGFWMRPEGRWIDPRQAPAGIYASNESVLIAAQGTLGETEVFCRPIFVTGRWLKNVYTQHFLRVVSGDTDYPGAYLFAFFRSEAAFRMLRSMSTGSKQQDLHEALRREIPVPECTPADRERIAETVRNAYRDRDEADRKEDQAFALLDDAIREAAR